jgi:hypothetical protein
MPVYINSLQFKENMCSEIILGQLRLDMYRKKMITAFPFITYVEKFINNYAQARNCVTIMEGD